MNSNFIRIYYKNRDTRLIMIHDCVVLYDLKDQIDQMICYLNHGITKSVDNIEYHRCQSMIMCVFISSYNFKITMM